MNNQQIIPEKVTRPIQLLAAWLIGLILIDGTFLAAASQISSPNWAPALLVVAAIVNVPLFLISIFLLQTRFRPEMQEDIYYSKYLEYQYTSRTVPKEESPKIEIVSQGIAEEIIKQIGPTTNGKKEQIEKILNRSQLAQIVEKYGGRRTLSELFLRPNSWPNLVDIWNDSLSFKNDVEVVLEEHLITMNDSDYKSCKLTALGTQVAEIAQTKNKLFASTHKEIWEMVITKSSTGKRRIEQK